MMTERKTRGLRGLRLPALALLLPALALLLSFSVHAAAAMPETAENGELFYRYMLSLAGDGDRAELQATGDARARALLSEDNQRLYDKLLERVERVARGEEENTDFLFTWEELGLTGFSRSAAELGLTEEQMTVVTAQGRSISPEAMAAMEALMPYRASEVVRALMSDYPELLYWFDKTKAFGADYGIKAHNNGSGWRLHFDDAPGDGQTWYHVQLSVSQDYAKRDGQFRYYIYSVDTGMAKAAAAAAAKAQKVVADNAGKNDWDKLQAYREFICEAVSYDDFAAEHADYPYGDPWQLVSVFDGDSETNVVCEGYSKAFQYLCDLSTFSDPSIQCWSVSGAMDTGSESGNHMWNVVRLNGRNYLADVTNCDGEDSVGYPDTLFLVKADRGSVADGYTVSLPDGSEIKYLYQVWENDKLVPSSDAEFWKDAGVLTLELNRYCGENVVWEIDDQGTLTISGPGDMFDYDPGETPWYSRREEIKSAVIGSGVTVIGDGAFAGCSNLRSVSISETVESMGYEVFSGCESLTAFTVAKENPMFSVDADAGGALVFEYGNEVRIRVLVRCPTNLSGYYQVPDSVLVVWDNAFDSCRQLNSIQLPSSVVEIKAGAFDGCDNLTDVYYFRERTAWEETESTKAVLLDLENSGVRVHALLKITMDSCGGTAVKTPFLTLENMPYRTLEFDNQKYILSEKNFVPTREGYLFQGWYTAREGGSPVDDDTMADPGVNTLYAHWTPLRSLAVSEAYSEKGLVASYAERDSGEYVLILQWRTDPGEITAWSAAYDENGRLIALTQVEAAERTSNGCVFSVTLSGGADSGRAFVAGGGFTPVTERCDMGSEAEASPAA